MLYNADTIHSPEDALIWAGLSRQIIGVQIEVEKIQPFLTLLLREAKT